LQHHRRHRRLACRPVPLFRSNTCSGSSAYSDYNNCPTGGDYGDWLSIYPYLVQDAEASPDAKLDISTDVGVNANHYFRPEVAVLDAVGYNLAAPEPGTLGLLSVSLGILVLVPTRICCRPRR